MKPGRVWVEGRLDGRERGAIDGPEQIGRRCQGGWSGSGVIGRVGKSWRLAEAWNVYPGESWER